MKSDQAAMSWKRFCGGMAIASLAIVLAYLTEDTHHTRPTLYIVSCLAQWTVFIAGFAYATAYLKLYRNATAVNRKRWVKLSILFALFCGVIAIKDMSHVFSEDAYLKILHLGLYALGLLLIPIFYLGIALARSEGRNRPTR